MKFKLHFQTSNKKELRQNDSENNISNRFSSFFVVTILILLITVRICSTIIVIGDNNEIDADTKEDQPISSLVENEETGVITSLTE